MTDLTKAGLLCPVCRVDLMMTDRQGVEVDYCPKCPGVWLDRGELDKIVERSAAYEASPPPSRAPEYRAPERHEDYRDHDSGKYRKPHKRKKSLLGEIFDF